MLRRVAAAAVLHPPPPPCRVVSPVCMRRHLCAVAKAVDLSAARGFWEQKGTLTQQSVSRLVEFAATHPILQQPPKLQEKLDGLRTVLGLHEPAVVQMAASCPNLLTFAAPKNSTPNTIAANFRALQARFSSFDVVGLVQRHPQLLATPGSTVERKLSALAKLLPGVDVASLATSYPRLLDLNVDTVRRNAKGLMKRFPRQDAVRMIAQHPNLLGSNLEGTVVPTFDRFREMFGMECAQRVCRTRPQLLTLNFQRSVVPKISELAELLECSEPEAQELMKRVPSLFGLKIPNLSAKVEALVQMFRELGSYTPREDFRFLIRRNPDVIVNRPRLVAHRVERLVALTGSRELARHTILTCPTLLTKGLAAFNRLAFANASGVHLSASTVLFMPKAALATKLPGYHDFLVAHANAQWLEWHSQLREDKRFGVHIAKRLLATNVPPTPSEIATALDSLPQAFARLELGDLESTVGDIELLRANTTAPTTLGWGE